MTYLYTCRRCGREWEHEARITAPPLRDCPWCSTDALTPGSIPKRGTARRLIAGTPPFHEVHRHVKSGYFMKGRS